MIRTFNLTASRARVALFVVALLGLGGVRAHAQVTGEAISALEISQLAGGFTGPLDDEDGFGYAVARIGDLNGDGIGDMAVGAWGDDDGGTDRGAVWILFLNKAGEVRSEQKISDLTGGFTGVLKNDDRFGYAVAGLGDHDGDGVEDLAVGALFDKDGGFDHGAIWILFLNTDGTVKAHQKISDTEGNFDGELHTRDYLGSSLAFLGDHDGDGVGDIASGAYRDGEGEFGTLGKEGAVWILRLDTDGTVKSHTKIASQVGGFDVFLHNRDNFGRAVASIGDLDGDGIGDLAVGAPISHDNEGDYWGVVWILFLNADATVKSYQRISPLDGGGPALENHDRFGFSIACLGDINADGVVDLAVGAILDDDGGPAGPTNRGAVWMLMMNADGTVKLTSKLSDTQGHFDIPLADDSDFGHGVASLGDHDGDGRIELAVGAARVDAGGPDRGAVYYIDPVAAQTANWLNLGHSLAGSGPAPVMVGAGPLQGEDWLTLAIVDAGPVGVETPLWLYASPAASYRVFMGGILVPDATVPGAKKTITTTSLSGQFWYRSRWPGGVPAGTQVFFHAWVADAGAPFGWAASNAIVATAP